jgi:hypothetical protein
MRHLVNLIKVIHVKNFFSATEKFLLNFIPPLLNKERVGERFLNLNPRTPSLTPLLIKEGRNSVI